MSIYDGDFLSHQGWDALFFGLIFGDFSDSLVPARVIGEERELYRLQWQRDHSCWGSVSGKLQYLARSRWDFPAVGDWVLIEVPDFSERVVIHAVCPRKSVLQRQQVGSSSGEAQIIGVNVDLVYIATSMNVDLNLRRLHRYVTVVLDSGARPIILLTKADLQDDGGLGIKNDVEAEFPGVDVRTLSMNDFAAATYFREDLGKGKTAVIVGSSGVGKSTLVNYLIGEERLKTQDIRESDGRGRHTTSSRCLFQSRFEGWIIDTPGMRELSLLDHEEGLNAQFADIEKFLGQCRFSDCQHQSEPGCAIQEALDQGLIDQDRWDSYGKLAGEIQHALRKQNRALLAEDRKRWKKLTQEGRARGENKRRIK